MEHKIELFDDLITSGTTCYASKKITEDGLKVGYMYRELPEETSDSGWRFYSGTEDDAYVENDENVMLYDLNTIANYDRAIINLIKKPIGTEWERLEGTNRFQLIEN